jgi:hypothetical protein
MPAIAQSDNGHAPLPGFGHTQLSRLNADGLSKALFAIDYSQHRCLMDDAHPAVGLDHPSAQPVDVGRNPDHAVRVVTGQIGFDQVAGDVTRLRLLTSGRDKEGADQPLKANVIEIHERSIKHLG